MNQTIEPGSTGRNLYFAYGSNMDSLRMHKHCPSAQIVGKACLQDWRLRFNKRGRDGLARATIQKAEGHRTWGVVYYLSPEEWQQLDTVEALGRGYECVQVDIQSGDQTQASHTYVGLKHAAGLALPVWYEEHMLKGATEQGLPPKYIKRLQQMFARKRNKQEGAG